MEDQKIIDMLEISIHEEEDFLSDYDNDDIWSLIRSNTGANFEKIKKLFMENISDTKRHYEKLNMIIKMLK